MAPALRCLPPLALVALLGLGCAGLSSAPQGSSYAFFAAPEPESDPWYAKVEDWQQREQNHRPHTGLADSATIRAKPDSGLLRVRMGRWEAEERLAMARRLATWSQAEARRHYRFDPPQNVVDDPWPTTKDLLDTDGDDCDGLDLIAYELMREFGFPPDQLYRAIVRRDRDRANHMVTLWFDNPEDPWVVDATGAVTMKVRRFSDLPGWTPTVIFNERVQFTPAQHGRLDAVARAGAQRASE
jgi:hypothetical protein